MKNCVRCGKEIDVISKDPDKVFYCKKCSLEILNINEEELFKQKNENIKRKSHLSFFILPGTYQLKEGNFIASFLYLYSFYLIPVAWFVFSLLIYSIESKNKVIVDGVRYYSVFVVIQMLIVFLKNILEVKSEINRDKSDI